MCIKYYNTKVRRKGDNINMHEGKNLSYLQTEEKNKIHASGIWKSSFVDFRIPTWKNDMLWHKARMMNGESSSC
jgi:hypothetical protein